MSHHLLFIAFRAHLLLQRRRRLLQQRIGAARRPASFSPGDIGRSSSTPIRISWTLYATYTRTPSGRVWLTRSSSIRGQVTMGTGPIKVLDTMPESIYNRRGTYNWRITNRRKKNLLCPPPASLWTNAAGVIKPKEASGDKTIVTIGRKT
jgi:hypothetical protein